MTREKIFYIKLYIWTFFIKLYMDLIPRIYESKRKVIASVARDVNYGVKNRFARDIASLFLSVHYLIFRISDSKIKKQKLKRYTINFKTARKRCIRSTKRHKKQLQLCTISFTLTYSRIYLCVMYILIIAYLPVYFFLFDLFIR